MRLGGNVEMQKLAENEWKLKKTGVACRDIKI